MSERAGTNHFLNNLIIGFVFFVCACAIAFLGEVAAVRASLVLAGAFMFLVMAVLGQLQGLNNNISDIQDQWIFLQEKLIESLESEIEIRNQLLEVHGISQEEIDLWQERIDEADEGGTLQ